MSGEVFDRQILADKLSKLNSSQQSIESLSRWCISHRKKAKQIIETWDKLFNSAQREQRVSFLYLANDILQNSRRKGSEFVNEFWKVLPGALKHVYGNGDEHGKKAASRLVDIWVERKVFGSRGENLKNEMLGKGPPSLSVSNRKSSNPIKIMKKDAHSLKIRLVVGGMPQKIVTAFQSVDDENISEEAALNKCKDAVNRVVNMEKSIESISTQGNQQGSAFLDEIQEQENVLQQCVRQLESAEATRIVLVSQLKEALQDQVPKLEHIRTQLQVARGQVEQVDSMRHKLTSPSLSGPLSTSTNPPMETTMIVEPNLPSIQPTSSALLPPLAQPVISFASSTTAEEENKKAAAAAVAAKLAASTSSAQMLTSVLSSLVAEEAAFGFASGLPMFSPKKRPKLETSSVSDVNNSEMSNTVYFNSLQQQPMTGVSLPQPTNMQSVSQDNQIKASFPPQPPPPPPLPPMPPPNSAANQFVQSAGLMVGVFPYGYGANSLLPLGPPSHNAMGARLVPQPLQQPQPPSQQLQPPTNGGFYQAPSNRIYGHSHQPVPPPLPRQ